MKSAREMFEELNYIYEEDNEHIIYKKYTKCNKLDHLIVFYKRTKDFEKYRAIDEKSICPETSVCINYEELQAINKQVEELQWK